MTLSLLPGEAAWRSRKVRYYAGDWTSIQTVLPEFELKPFSAGGLVIGDTKIEIRERHGEGLDLDKYPSGSNRRWKPLWKTAPG